MKKVIFLGALSLICAATVNAAQPREISSDKVAQAEFKKMTLNKNLPAWVKQGGTTSETKSATIAGKQYLVFSSCKPHDCASEQIATLYSPTTKAMSSVYSVVNDKTAMQQLKWMTNQPEISIAGKTVLLAALTGALENYPQKFNF